MPYVSECPWLHSLNAQVKTLVADLVNLLRGYLVCQQGKFCYRSVVAVFNQSDVDINDVAIFENFVIAWDAVTNDMINRGADRFETFSLKEQE